MKKMIMSAAIVAVCSGIHIQLVQRTPVIKEPVNDCGCDIEPTPTPTPIPTPYPTPTPTPTPNDCTCDDVEPVPEFVIPSGHPDDDEDCDSDCEGGGSKIRAVRQENEMNAFTSSTVTEFCFDNVEDYKKCGQDDHYQKRCGCHEQCQCSKSKPAEKGKPGKQCKPKGCTCKNR